MPDRPGRSVLLDSHEITIAVECPSLVSVKEMRVEEALSGNTNVLFSLCRGKDRAPLATASGHCHSQMTSILFVLLLLGWRKLEYANLAARCFGVQVRNVLVATSWHI